jgi:hypothetical protein
MVSSYAVRSTAKPRRTFRRYPDTTTGHHCDDVFVATWVTNTMDGSERRAIAFDACFRAPHFAANERAFRAVVASAQTT